MDSVASTVYNDVLLLVEGEDDKHFVHHLLNKRQLDFSMKIESADGVYKLLNRLRTEAQPDSRKVLGIIVDADDDFNNRWKEIIDALSKYGVSTPETPTRSGTIIPSKNKLPKIGIWIMPDNESNGELEDFVFKMISKNDKVIPLAQKYISDITENHQKFAHKRTKAELFAWLANTKKPGRIGASIGADNFDIHSSNSNEFVKWLQQLLG